MFTFPWSYLCPFNLPEMVRSHQNYFFEKKNLFSPRVYVSGYFASISVRFSSRFRFHALAHSFYWNKNNPFQGSSKLKQYKNHFGKFSEFCFSFFLFLGGSSVGSSALRGMGDTSQGFHEGTGVFAESAFWSLVRWYVFSYTGNLPRKIGKENMFKKKRSSAFL